MTRPVEEIRQGLAGPRPARRISSGERIHVVGAAGAGASAAALLAQAAGAAASGCDAGGPSPYTAAIEVAGIPVTWGHDARHVGADGPVLVDRLAVTTALTSVDPDHPELVAARTRGVPIEAWQQVIADAAATHGGRLVAVAGTHGKSTTSGWLVHLLAGAGRDPAAFVGALLPAEGTRRSSTARWGRGDVFVVEADEYAGNFDPYRPSVAVLLNAEWDHPDVFVDEAAVLDAFEGWIRAAGSPVLVANSGDPGVARLLTRLHDWPGRLVTFALADHPAPANRSLLADRASDGHAFRADLGDVGGGHVAATIVDEDAAGTTLEIRFAGPDADASSPVRATIALPGRQYAVDALGVAGAAFVLGIPPDAIRDGLESFRGVGRRMEVKGEVAGVTVIDDYGHHPTAIRATLDAVRQRFPGRRTWAVYEPLTYQRTAAMLEAFADVLSFADRAVVADIWALRDPDTTITSAEALAGAVRARGRAPASAPGSVEATADHLAGAVEPGDVVVVMGGGRSYVIAERLVAALRTRESGPSDGSGAGRSGGTGGGERASV